MTRLTISRRAWLAGAASLPLVGSSVRVTGGQSEIPDGVFVRDSTGAVWLVLEGRRVAVAFWSANDDQIAAIPTSDRWAVMNEAGVIVAGERPGWLGAFAAASTDQSPPSDEEIKAGAVVEVPQLASYRAANGALVVIGTVQNNSDDAVGPVELGAVLIGLNGSREATARAVVGPRVLPPHGRSGWMARFPNAPQFSEIRVLGGPRKAAPNILNLVTHELRVDNAAVRPANREHPSARIVGLLVNVAQRPIVVGAATATAFAANGELLDVSRGFARLGELQPGQSTPFEITFAGGRAPRDIPRYELFAEGLFKA